MRWATKDAVELRAAPNTPGLSSIQIRSYKVHKCICSSSSFFFLNQFRPFAFPLKMEPYLTSGTNIYSESTNTERLNAVRDLLPAEAPTFAVFARCNLRRILFLFNCRQALFVNQKHTANLYFGKQKNLCVSFSPARLGSADGSRFAGGGEKKMKKRRWRGVELGWG